MDRKKRATEYDAFSLGTEDLIETGIPGIKYRDITPHINRIIDKWNVRDGIVSIQTKHTTAGLVLLVQENEAGLVKHDIPKYYIDEKLRPEWKRLRDRRYAHDREERIAALGGNEPRNGVSHLLAASLSKPTIADLNIHKGALDLGTWQSVLLFVDFDAAPHHPGRDISICVERRRS